MRLIGHSKNGYFSAIQETHLKHVSVYGIFGGFQIMGDMIDKPNQVEGDTKSIPGLQILPVTTILNTIKTKVQREFYFLNNPIFCKGYEIHIGETISNQNSPLCNYTENSIKKEEDYFLNPKT